MSTKTVWFSGFVLSFLACLFAIAFRLGWLQPLYYRHYRIEKAREEVVSELRGSIIPDFPVYPQNKDTLGIFDLLQSSKGLILFLGPGCAPCDDRTIFTLAEFQRTKAQEIGLEVIVLVFRYDQEFIHLRKLAQYNFQGKMAKFSSTNGYDIPRYPALYLIEKGSHKVLDVHFPHAETENQLRKFLKGLAKLKFSNSEVLNPTTDYGSTLEQRFSLLKQEDFNSLKSRPLTKKRLILDSRFSLKHSADEDLISSPIIAFAAGKNGEIFFSHEGGNKVSIFDDNGTLITTITDEDVFGPGARNTRSCRRILPLDEAKVCLLYFGFVNDLVIYDWKSKKFAFFLLKDKNERRAHPVVDIAISTDRIYLLAHPQRALGYVSKFAEIIELDFEGKKRNSFAAFPDLEFPNLSEHLASNRDQILLSKANIIYASCPLGDRIYRFDLLGKRLGDLIYPKGSFVQLDRDAPDDYREWYKHYPKFKEIDLISEIFCLRKDNADNIVAVRQRERSLYFDLFDKTGVRTELGEYTEDDFEELRVANRENLFYGFKWPEIKNDQFVAYGNPEIVVYRLDL